MLINGEKYACEACVRGHRVSNCQHSDRPLQHINKKGRPVSQCQHCRAMRKSRAAHVKCDCGEKTSKCAHLSKTVDGHRDTCCCNHGGRCTCAHKKEQSQLDTVPESDSDRESSNARSAKGGIRSRRRANTIHSDGMLSFDANGHHKPPHKNRMTQKCGPYQLNRVSSLQNTSSLGSPSTEGYIGRAAAEGRSSASRSAGSREQRRVKSETASPLLSGSPTFQQLNTQLPPLDISAIPPYMSGGTFDLFGGAGFSPDTDGPMFSAGLSAASVDWSHYNLADVKGDNFAPSSYSQAGAQSFNGLFDFSSEQTPTLAGTTSTSGEVSEVEDNFIPGDIDYDGFNGGSDFMRQGQLMSSGLNSINYDSFLKGSANKYLPTPGSLDDGPIAGGAFSLVDDDPAFWAQNYDGIATLAESPDGVPSNTFWDGH